MRSTRLARRPLVALAAGLLSVAAVLSACTNRADVAAEVAGTPITVAQFDATVQKGLDDPTVGKVASESGAAYRRQVLTYLIKQQLVDRLLKANGITYTESELTAFEKENLNGLEEKEAQAQALASGQPFTTAELRGLALEYFLYQELGKKIATTPYDEQVATAVETLKKTATTFDLSVVYLSSQKEADSALADLKSGKTTFEALGKSLPPDSQGNPQPATQQAFDPTGLDAQAPELANAIRASKAGDFIPYSNGTSFLIVEITKVNTKTDAEIQQAAEAQVASTLSTAGQTEAAKQAATYEVYVNPRFGSLERPTQSLPSVAGSSPATFTTPGSASPSAGTPAVDPTGTGAGAP